MPDDANTHSQRKVIPSGNSELDSRLGGGIPAGSLVLIEGSSGAGKSVLAQQIMWGSLEGGFRVSLFTSENSVKSLVIQMQQIDFDTMDFVLLGKFKIYPVELSQLQSLAVATLVKALKEDYRRYQPDILVVDSFTPAIANATDQQVLSFFEECKRLSARGVTIIVTLHNQDATPDLMSTLRSMCDAHLILTTEQDGQRLVKMLTVAKVRGASSVTGSVVGFEVEPGWGMRVIPISKARG